MPKERVYTQDEVAELLNTEKFRTKLNNFMEDFEDWRGEMKTKCDAREEKCEEKSKRYTDRIVGICLGVPATLSLVFLVVINWSKVVSLFKGA